MFGMETNIFAGRKVLLSAAARGLGPTLARSLVSRGAEVIGIDGCAQSLDSLRVEVGGSFTVLASNRCDELSVTEIARWVADEHGSLFAVICNLALPWPATTMSRLETTRSIVQSRLLAALVAPQLAVGAGSQMIVLAPDIGVKPLDFSALGEGPGDEPRILRATLSDEMVRAQGRADRAAAQLLSAANDGLTSVRLSQSSWARLGARVSQRFCAPLHKVQRAATP